MELRWYWRVLQRHARLIWTTTAIVAVLALLLTAYTFYGGRNKITTTIEFYQPTPQIFGNALNQNPHDLALATAGATTGDAKFYSTQIIFFKDVAARITSCGLNLGWKSVQAGLGANITGGRDFELEYISSNASTATCIVNAARDEVTQTWLPRYNRDVIQPGVQRLSVTYPVKWFLSDPTTTRTQSLTSNITGWVLKALLGLVLGIALAFLWEYLDESITDEQDVRHWVGVPTLGVIPGGKHRIA